MTPFSRAICSRPAEQCGSPAFCLFCSLPLWLGGVFLLLVTGCASPGIPHPPSLMLPKRVDDLRAERIGDGVLLHWTSPAETTDHVPLRGPVSAEICRDLLPEGAPNQKPTAPSTCTVIQTVDSSAGERTVSDPLPAPLLCEPARALAYRVLLRNAAGHSAGASDAVLAAAGSAPSPILQLQGRPAVGGVALHWSAVNSGPGTAIQLLRSPLPNASGSPSRRHGSGMPVALAGSSSRAETAPVRLLAVPAGTPDSGGAVDPTAERGQTYAYSAVRLRTVLLGGATLTFRSVDSAPVTVLARDIAPPAAPAELVLVTEGLTADLSWQPGFEPDLAGYLVYRAELPSGGATVPAGSWQRLTLTPVPLPAFHDTLPHPGSFAFRVAAVDRSGNESPASSPAFAEGTAPVP